MIAMVLCAMLSASAKWLNLRKRERKTTLMAEAATATAAGVGVFLLRMAFNFDVYLGCFFALASGFLGVSGIQAIFKNSAVAAVKKMGVDIEPAKKDD